jgi:hypothetical protein
MADDNHQRPFGSNDRYGRAAPRSAPGNDPLAELARLIGQTDPFAEFGRQQQPQRAQPSQDQSWGMPGEGAPSAAPPVMPSDSHYGYEHAPQSRHAQQPFAQGGYDAVPPGAQNYQGYDSNHYYDDAQTGAVADEDAYDDVPPSRRRLGVIAIAAVLAIAVVGTAGAFGYRALFGTSSSSPPRVITADPGPSKVVPASKSEPQASKQIYDRVGERSAGEKLVSREEQPLERPQPPVTANALNAASAAQQAVSVPPAPIGMAGTEPKKVRTIAIKPDQPQGIGEPSARTGEPPRAAAAP